MNALTAFEKQIAEIAHTYCRDSLGEDAAGKRDALATFLAHVMEAARVQVANAGGDPEYLPDEDKLREDVAAAFQEPVDQDEIKRERAAA